MYFGKLEKLRKFSAWEKVKNKQIFKAENKIFKRFWAWTQKSHS